MNKYIGHPNQISGVEEVQLLKGKGKGMTLLNIRNGKGLYMSLCPDRAMDIVKVEFKGDNIGYLAPCGYVSPEYYDNRGSGFLKSFTAGFMTTCGISAVGSPCIDKDEELPLHGNIANTPCEEYSYTQNYDEITVVGVIRDASIFGNSYLLTREYRISKKENTFTVTDNVKNIGNTVAPCMLLYHINFGYPLLGENAKVYIPSNGVVARNEHAAKNIDSRLDMEKPQPGYEECCYFYDVKAEENTASAGIYNDDIKKGVKISYRKDTLNYFTQWKMMGEYEYVLGLEPGNCTPDGRNVMREKGLLKELNPGEEYSTNITIKFSEKLEEVECL